MTKEELKQEAKESFEQYKVTDEDYVVSPYSDDMGEKMLMYNDEYYAEETYLRLYKQGYLAGAEPREKRIAELEAQIEKLIDFVLSKTECCDICPITDTCINSEGTCPYAGILSKGEEAVTREWLMKKIAKEIKEE